MIIAITTGEPAGIGPELTAQVLQWGLLTQASTWPSHARFVVLGDAALIRARATAVGLDWTQLEATERVTIEHIPLRAPCTAGQLDPAHAPYVLDLLDYAIAGATSSCETEPNHKKKGNRARFSAVVTAPLQKSTIHDARIRIKNAHPSLSIEVNTGRQTAADRFLAGDTPFLGHTEYFAAQTNAPQVVMMLAGKDQLAIARQRTDHTVARPLRVALATTHLPLQAVSSAITQELLFTTLTLLHRELKHFFGLPAPIILVAGLNPHAGESGHCGREEIDAILPALKAVQEQGIDARGPYPADTLFQPLLLDTADCVLALYHDQGLPVLKYATFGHAFNITLGLPFIRTSVDHGTALELAGTGHADPGSFMEALTAAIDIANRIQK